jgi:ribosomal protein S18 acetylase RimI-like enzyme
MIIKKASIEDIEIASNLFELYRQFYKQEPDRNSAKKFLSERIKENESVIYLAIDEEKKSGMGFVQLYPAFSSVSMKRIWILNDLFVHEDYRKQGVAEALIRKSKELAIETKAKGIVLETHSSNDNAQKLYHKLGFKKDDEHYYYYLEVK